MIVGSPSAAVTALAQAVYDGDAEAAGPLHDALEECGAVELAEHFRQPTTRLRCDCGGDWAPLKKDFLPMLSVCEKCHADGPFMVDVEKAKAASWHPKGCWALDLILGKE